MPTQSRVPHEVYAFVQTSVRVTYTLLSQGGRTAISCCVPLVLLTLVWLWGVGQTTPVLAQMPVAVPIPQVLRGATASAPVTPVVFTGDLRNLPRPRAWQPGEPVREVPKRRQPWRDRAPVTPETVSPPLPAPDLRLDLQERAPSSVVSRAFSRPRVNFNGQGFSGVFPPDPVGDVGLQHYIQMVNGSAGTAFTVYSKRDGQVAAGPIFLQSLGKGPCGSGLGDPIVLYDQLAGRWLLSEFSNTGNRLCVYISRTDDPITGGWLFYSFHTPDFPDYPKYAVWPDAYYVSTNESAPALYALDRRQMLAGGAATMQRFTVPRLDGFDFQALTPSDVDSLLPPPAGAPNYFMRHRDDETHDAVSADSTRDFLEIWEFHVDFATPANSTVAGPTTIAIAEIDSDLCGVTSFSCFPQPDGGSPLDPLREVVMWRLQYRNFGTYETLVGNLVTDVDQTDHGGIRWFELRKRGNGPWQLFQEGTYAPDAANRWLASIAMDRAGNIAMGYSITSETVKPGIRYVGRLVTDPPGTMPQGEFTLVKGQGVQAGDFSERWGDYSSINVDPADDCTFWYTNEYIRDNGEWATRIGAFAFDACLQTRFVLSTPELHQGVCAPGESQPIPIELGLVRDFTQPVILSYANLPAGIRGQFSHNPVRPPGQSLALLRVGPAVAAGEYPITINAAMTAAHTKQIAINVAVHTAVPDAVRLRMPPDGAQQQLRTPSFSWTVTAQGNPGDTYILEIDDDPAFGSIDYSATVVETSHTLPTPLASATEYFWRVRAVNACGEGSQTAVFSFSTGGLQFCTTSGQRIPDHDPAGLTDSLEVSQPGRLTDLNVFVAAQHSQVGDLVARLTHASTGTTVTLLDRPGVPASLFGCAGNNMTATLDDEASDPVEEACAPGRPTILGTFRPNGLLHTFAGENMQGTWTLTIADLAAEDQGRLTEWCLLPTVVQRFALRGAVTGIVPQRVTCTNQTTGKDLPLQDVGPSWNCTEDEFLARRGERVQVRIQGKAVTTVEELGGVAAGMTSRTAICRNTTTGKSVSINLRGATSWDCTAAGLQSTPGDSIVMVVSGTAD